jgi:hypothetical protein
VHCVCSHVRGECISPISRVESMSSNFPLHLLVTMTASSQELCTVRYVERRELLIIGSNLLLVLSTTFGSMELLGICIGGSTCGGWAIGSESTGKEDDASLRHSMVMLQLAVTSIILSVSVGVWAHLLKDRPYKGLGFTL